MSTLAFLLLCVQACLVQNVYGVCRGSLAGPFGYEAGLAGPIGYGYGYGPGIAGIGLEGGFAGPIGLAGCGAAYGGAGVGDVSVAGEMAVGGTTLVAGQVPILGAVEFGGIVPAAGAVSIAGSCGCGCNGYIY
ncbi:chorion class CA protein ERA.1-like [Vanessa tameamea]|uniref:Chorion class CA protein ERA.1-like n=1 Tax=Vanessa tameamea TaxID=334116 RepID=A0A8B8I0W2_VANTA